MAEPFAPYIEPPYFAVIFSNRLSPDHEGYEQMANRMAELALGRPGCLGVESARDASGFGITVSFWRDERSIAAWKADAQHLIAQKLGIEKWYERFELRVARVERAYSGPEGRGPA